MMKFLMEHLWNKDTVAIFGYAIGVLILIGLVVLLYKTFNK